jgi:hypothetical protein
LPGFVDRNRIIASMPSLSLLTLAEVTPLKHYLAEFSCAAEPCVVQVKSEEDLVLQES